jgi:hypothetical protein
MSTDYELIRRQRPCWNRVTSIARLPVLNSKCRWKRNVLLFCYSTLRKPTRIRLGKSAPSFPSTTLKLNGGCQRC